MADSSSFEQKEPADVMTSAGTPDHDDLYRPEVDTSSVNESKLMRKVDIYVIPWLALLYLLNFLDRGTIGNAKLYGLETDISISDNQYLIALTLFFFPYALFEPVSNVLLRRLKPSIWLSLMIFFWGVVTTLHGILHNYGGLLGESHITEDDDIPSNCPSPSHPAVRIFLGVAEAGMYPGIVFYISSWYKRTELGSRVAVFFSSATVAGAFSGLLAAAIHNMDGVAGLEGWRWIFILEGLFTVLVGVASFWVIQDFRPSF